MIEFYSWPRAVFYLITLLFGFCALSQALAMVSSYYRHPRNRKWLFETLLELFVLIQIISCSLLHGQVHEGYFQGFYIPSGYAALRIVVFTALLLLTTVVFTLNKNIGRFSLLLVAVFSLITLPVIERHTGKAFAFLFIAGLFFYFIRGIRVSILRYREIKTSLSAFSVKNAIDSMHTGILFCENDGYILLSNARMEELIRIIFGGAAHRNANHLYERLVSGDIACPKTEFEGQIVCLLSGLQPNLTAGSSPGEASPLDAGAWMFTRTELFFKRRKYIQLTATDISEQWQLTAQLQEKNDELKQRNKELNETIDNLHILSQERETQKAKMHAHDVLGQSLSVLLRSISGGQADYDQFRSMSQGLLDQLKSDRPVPSPHDEFESLKQVFGSIGVEILLNGELPQDNSKALLIMEIIRESVTNAVRHGFATQISVQIEYSGSGSGKDACKFAGCHLEITDNGQAPDVAIIEGDGLTGMGKKLAAHGGVLSVVTRPGFVLEVDLP